MDQSRYVSLRKQVDLSYDRDALPVYLIQDLVLITASLAVMILGQRSAWRFAAIPLISVLLFRNFSQMHEAVHGLVSKRRWVNGLSGVISGAICMLPFTPWRHVHLQHHVWAGNIDRDPVTAIIRRFPSWPIAVQESFSLLWRAWIPVMAAMQYFVFWFHSAVYLVKVQRSFLDVASVVSTFFFWAAAASLLPAGSFKTVVVPAIVLYFVAVEVVNFPHHLRLPQFRGETKHAPRDQYVMSRTCLYPRWVSRFIVLNFNYHAEHHMFPDAAWYHLPKLQEIVSRELGSDYNVDPQFAWILDNRPRRLREVLAETRPRQVDEDEFTDAPAA